MLGSALALLLGTTYWFREEISFLAKMAVPGPAYRAAEKRSSDPAPTLPTSTTVAGATSTTAGATVTTAPVTTAARADGTDVPLPRVRSTPPPDGTAPRVALGPLLALGRPSAVADPPGPGPVLVSTLDGQVHQIDLAARTAPVVLDLAGSISTGGERGLLGIAVDAAGDRLYANFTNPRGDTEVRSWALGDAGRPARGAGVLHLTVGQPFANHNGGNLVFGPDGALWIGMGDGGGAADPGEVGQDPDELLGKMLRVVPDPAGGVRAPSSNPDWGKRPEVWGIGLRNPWRYSFDRATNRLWIADVGQNTIEEVSVIDPTAPSPNFGWDDVEGNNDYEGTRKPGFTMPVVTYTHDDGCSVTGGYVYRGAANPGLYGWYLFGDYCGGWVRAVPSSNPGSRPVELLRGLGGVISFGELEDGELLLLTGDGIRRLVST